MQRKITKQRQFLCVCTKEIYCTETPPVAALHKTGAATYGDWQPEMHRTTSKIAVPMVQRSCVHCTRLEQLLMVIGTQKYMEQQAR